MSKISREEFMKYTEDQCKEMAEAISKNITIRFYGDYGSKDTKRPATKVEQDILKNIAYAVLLSYKYRDGGVDNILDTAEFTLSQFIPEANGYDSIYIPCLKAMGIQ